MKKLLILGATGRTGKHLLAEALQRGHSVNVLVRDAKKISVQSNQLTIFEGISTDSAILTKAMQGCETVLSALNISRTSDFPWAALRTPTDFLSNTIKNIIRIAPQAGTKHVIITSAWGVLETKANIPFWFRWLIDCSNIGYGYREHENQETLLASSNLNYTAVRAVALINRQKAKSVRVFFGVDAQPSLIISRLNVAKFMLEVAENHSYLRQSPIVSE